MSDKFFLDTNVLVYSFDKTAPAKRRIAGVLVEEAAGEHQGLISFQVVQEFFSVASRKFADPMSVAESEIYLESVLWPMCAVLPSQKLYESALRLRAETGFSFYDSLIVAAALEAGCKTIYSEDLQHGRRLHGLEIKNPF